jgi:hypothetical protein
MTLCVRAYCAAAEDGKFKNEYQRDELAEIAEAVHNLIEAMADLHAGCRSQASVFMMRAITHEGAQMLYVVTVYFRC